MLKCWIAYIRPKSSRYRLDFPASARLRTFEKLAQRTSRLVFSSSWKRLPATANNEASTVMIRGLLVSIRFCLMFITRRNLRLCHASSAELLQVNRSFDFKRRNKGPQTTLRAGSRPLK